MKSIYKFYNEQKIVTILFASAFFFCLFFIFIYKIQEESNSELMYFVYAISISIIASFIFYIFNIYLPERKRKNIIKNHFEEEYIYFKKCSIEIFLSAIDETSETKIEERLCDLDEFKKYFKERSGSYKERRYKVWDKLNGNPLKDILIQLGILRDEIAFILNNIEINDKSVLSFFRLLSQYVYAFQARGIDMDYDEIKKLQGFLWQLFSGWDNINGYRKDDIIMLMVEKI